jgi:hypothetical protein
MNTFCPDVYFANASFCSGDIFSRNDVSSIGADGEGVVDVVSVGVGIGIGSVAGGGGVDDFFTTVVYLRISCDKDDFIIEIRLSNIV